MKKLFTNLYLIALGSLISLTMVHAQGAITTNFSDVDYNDYYANALNNMVYKNVIGGYENGNFGPNDQVSRAQLITILDRYDQQLIINELESIVCSSLSSDQLPTDHPYYGNTKVIFEAICHQEAP